MATWWNSIGKVISASPVVPSDTLDVRYDALFVGSTGNVAVICRDDTADDANSGAVTLFNVASGEILPFSVRRVLSTNTTASNIIGLTTGQ